MRLTLSLFGAGRASMPSGSDGIARAPSTGWQHFDDVGFSEVAVSIAIEIEAARRKMPKPSVLAKRLQSIKERSGPELYPVTPRAASPTGRIHGSGRDKNAVNGPKRTSSADKKTTSALNRAFTGGSSVFGDLMLFGDDAE